MELICWQDAYMGYIVGEARGQQTLFPVALDDLIAGDHFCRVIDGFVGRLDFVALGFERAVAAETGRPGYDPRDLLKLYLYGYLQQVRSSRRLEAECKRNVEVMWLLGRLEPDHKSIAEFRRLHLEGVIAAGAELVRFARSVGLVRGEWVAIDGSKFQAVASARAAAERESMKRYLEAVDRGDEQEQARIDPAAVAAALEKLKQDAEPEASFMRTGGGKLPAYNVQTAVDAEHALIVAHEVSTVANDRPFLEPMAAAAHQAVGAPAVLNVVADAGYSNGAQAEACEARGIVPHVPAQRSVNSHGKGKLFDRSQFVHDQTSDTLLCPAGQKLARKQVRQDKTAIVYAAPAAVCGGCALKADCTTARQRTVFVHLHEAALKRMQERATPERMRLRRCTVEHPFGTLKYRILGHPRLLLRGVAGARIEIGLGILAYNLKRMINVLGGGQMVARLSTQPG
jgi:transposase